ncbi:hypothetical protein HAX54_033003 [Datura stramonium]|uniref:Uncharacterized protein n=1 Tax=Datura stramonium TaxID=4076 RepID=A0ABS8SD71_DATST|nr:hypothetical protein [Datura stramonium]
MNHHWPPQPLVSFSLSATEELTFCHSSNGGLDIYHQDDGPSLAPSRSNPFSLWETEVPMDHQVSDGPSRRPSLRPEVQFLLVKEGWRADGPSGYEYDR